MITKESYTHKMIISKVSNAHQGRQWCLFKCCQVITSTILLSYPTPPPILVISDGVHPISTRPLWRHGAVILLQGEIDACGN